MTTERPIRFNDSMVASILDGRKTQTRRLSHVTDKDCKPGMITPAGCFVPRSVEEHIKYCKYGQCGDRLWVREIFYYDADLDEYFYKADGDLILQEWRQSNHMPRSASRILLEITNIGIERLNDISEKDAYEEGTELWAEQNRPKSPNGYTDKYNNIIAAYRALWESINGQGSWDLNPFVWVIEFKVLEIKK